MADPSTTLARVVLPLPLTESFVYRIPPELEGEVRPGSQVIVPFRNRRLRGFVVEMADRPPSARLKEIERTVGAPVAPRVLDLTRWVSEYYLAPWGEVLRAAVPRPAGRGPRDQATADGGRGELPPPTEHQRRVLEVVCSHVDRGGGFKVFLLQGVTGSGKTFVYCKAAAEVLRRGGSCLVLVPEISLSAQLVDRFREVFGDLVAVSHSGLTPTERYTSWCSAAEGRAKIVVGARSAVFTPTKDLGLIVVDEEHEPSYKQAEVPRYNARDVAVKRGQMEGCPVLLGSATPSLESYHNASAGRYEMLRLPCRIDSRPLARVHIVDMKRAGENGPRDAPAEGAEGSWLFSELLCGKMRERLGKGEQVILFLNRRGHSTFVQCRDCGEPFRCPRCEVSLTYHSEGNRLTCHYCGYTATGVDTCPKCEGMNFWFGGVGTQKVESEIRRLFPDCAVLRMDVDSTRRRGSQKAMVEAFSSRRAQVLLGTQMVAKGFDFPGVTLVGVIYADTQLNLPDFRASERTFQLLTQVAGRAGRGDAPGEVVIQTFLPDHPSLKAAAQQDFELFYEHEIAERQELLFPPFSRLADVSFVGRNQEQVVECSTAVARRLQSWLKAQGVASVEVMGPAPYPLARIRNKARWHLTLRGRSLAELRHAVRATLQIAEQARPRTVAVGVDVDPLQLM